MRKLAGILLNLIICLQITSGNEPYLPLSSKQLTETWRWKSFAELSDKGIRCMAEGPDHSLWFGTAKGLFQFDGLIWNRYYEENEILSSPIYGLCYSSTGKLYVVSAKGIAHLENGRWTTDLIFPEKGVFGSEWEILNMYETRNDEIWVGLYFGLVRINKEVVTLYTTPTQVEGIGPSFKNVVIKDLKGQFDDIDQFVVFDLIEDRNSHLWLGLEDGRTLFIPNSDHDLTQAMEYRLYTEADNMLLSRLPLLFETREGLIYNISQSVLGGINSFDPSTGKWTAVALSDTFGGDNLYFSICETPDNVLWVGGLSRLFSLKNGTWTEYKQPETQIPPTRVIVYPVNDGSLWIIGHLADVSRIEYSTPQWQTYHDLIFQCETSDGARWFIDVNGKAICLNTKTGDWSMSGPEFPLSDPVRLFVDKAGFLWALGSHNGSAALAWSIDGIWQMKTFPELCWGFHPNGVYQTRDNTIWFGAQADCGNAGWGIIRFHPEKGYSAREESWDYYKGEQICEAAYAVCETEDNTLLCGYYKGLFEFNGTTRRDLHQQIMGDIIKVECMIQDPVKGVWIGTRSQGVIHYINDKEWTQYTVEEGLASNSVSSLMISDDSALWVATDKGISLFDRKKWVKLALPDNFRIVRGNGSMEKGSENSIWINIAPIEWYRRVFYKKSFGSGQSALISYQIKPEKNAPETRITLYEAKVHYPGNSMIFWEGTDQWNATNPGELQFSYRLDSEPWSNFSHEQSHHFLSLRRGKHQLQVRARDSFMNIDQTPALIGFRVIPPLWGRIWFIFLILCVVSTIAYLLTSSMRKNKLMVEQNMLMKKNNQNLLKQQAEIEEKGKQIMDLLEKERESKWLNEGVLLINEVIKQNPDDLKSMASGILNKLIQYLELSSGAILLYQADSGEKGQNFLEIIAAFGVNRERLSNKKLLTSEGLSGACYTEKRTMVIDNVPDSYFLESGLGHTRLTHLVLLPLKLHDQVAGVLELSSLKKIEPKKLQLLEIVAENIASNIISIRSGEKIRNMYELAQQQAAQMHEQEEELRQQMEEMHAIQEESRRRESDLIRDLDELKKALAEKRKKR